jgi:hypothetical protein
LNGTADQSLETLRERVKTAAVRAYGNHGPQTSDWLVTVAGGWLKGFTAKVYLKPWLSCAQAKGDSPRSALVALLGVLERDRVKYGKSERQP